MKVWHFIVTRRFCSMEHLNIKASSYEEAVKVAKSMYNDIETLSFDATR